MEDKVSDSATAVPDEWGFPDPTKEIDKLVKEAINKALGGAERQIQNVTSAGKRQIQQYVDTGKSELLQWGEGVLRETRVKQEVDKILGRRAQAATGPGQSGGPQ